MHRDSDPFAYLSNILTISSSLFQMPPSLVPFCLPILSILALHTDNSHRKAKYIHSARLSGLWPLRSLSSFSYIGVSVLGVRLSSHHWCVVGGPGEKTDNDEKARLETNTTLCLFPRPMTRKTVQLLTISYPISYSITISRIPFLSFLKPAPDAEIFPGFLIFCTNLACYFSMAQFKCPWLGLATTPSRPNPSPAGWGTARGEDYAYSTCIYARARIEAWVETTYMHESLQRRGGLAKRYRWYQVE